MNKHPSALPKFTQPRRFMCCNCGLTVDAPKVKGRTHPGHIKHMYCCQCKETTKHIQME